MDGWIDGCTHDINFDSSNISLFKYTIVYIYTIRQKSGKQSSCLFSYVLFWHQYLWQFERVGMNLILLKGYLILLRGYLILLSFFNSQVVLLVPFLWCTCTWSSFHSTVTWIEKIVYFGFSYVLYVYSLSINQMVSNLDGKKCLHISCNINIMHISIKVRASKFLKFIAC